jgi:hypothetical protein
MEALKRFEITEFGPYRFIGKSVYARAGKSGYIFGGLWGNADWVFEELNKLSDYATDEVHSAALVNWEKYDKKTALIGYTVGKFMKADTPVPEDMDYFDIPKTFVAKGWFSDGKYRGDAEAIVMDALSQYPEYANAVYNFMVEVYNKDAYGYYINCDIK